MTHVLSFIFGALVIFAFFEINASQLKEHWQFAYQVGRDDGYAVGKAEFDLSHEELEAKCMFFYADEYKR